ncbi:hypothetical protein Rhopal_001960-T1 [Rhodotorula paludigena]|uniref:Nucleotide-diphospho-sugar transferase domain-containing protein n=1 Tax=Rhodotorula paludigena TaxID=86838 RepID=A0AAV5GEP4_9BASI|nr:hypothetical protein Rhopal_001960-T1 [Rhodotorula paludigena]
MDNYRRLRASQAPRSPSINLPTHLRDGGGGSLGGGLSTSGFSATPSAVLDAFSSLTPRAKKLLVAVVVGILFIGAPLVRSSGDRGTDVRKPVAATVLPELVTARAAPDGTLRAGLFRPPQGSPTNDPSTSFTAYLEAHFGPPSLPLERQPHVWITMADTLWARTGTAALHSFVERLNVERRARYGHRRGGVRDTRLVVLCLDEGCVDEVAKYRDAYGRDAGGGYAYAGYKWNRPEKPYMATHDLVAQENDSFDHFNTGWMWIRHSKAASDAWNEVLQMDLRKTSRDQNNFNEVMGTALLRQHSDGGDPRRKPLLADFTATNGMRVHVLDDNIFRSHHFENDRPYAARDQSVYLHMTCGDDTLTKTYVSKTQGFWSDVNRYYSEPPPLLTVDHLSGSREDARKILRILLVAAHYTQRAILPPTHVTFLDVQPASSSPSSSSAYQTRRIYSSFPIPHIAETLRVEILEPRYPAWAARELVGGSVLGNFSSDGGTGGRRLREDVKWSKDEWRRRYEKVAELGEVVEIAFAPSRAPTIKLINYDWPSAQHWRSWALPRAVQHIYPCEELEKLPSCDAICRGSKRGVRVEEGWPSWDEVMGHGTE